MILSKETTEELLELGEEAIEEVIMDFLEDDEVEKNL